MQIADLPSAPVLSFERAASGSETSVRFLATVEFYDSRSRVARLKRPQSSRPERIVVDASLVAIPVCVGTTYTLICDRRNDVLTARIMRDATGIDVRLYDEALRAVDE